MPLAGDVMDVLLELHNKTREGFFKEALSGYEKRRRLNEKNWAVYFMLMKPSCLTISCPSMLIQKSMNSLTKPVGSLLVKK